MAAPVFVIILQKIKRGQNYLCSYEICVDDFFKRMKFEFYLIAVNIIAYYFHNKNFDFGLVCDTVGTVCKVCNLD